jgi:PilZ domain
MLQLTQQKRCRPDRLPCKLPVQARLERVTEEGLWLATIRDISVDGIGLMVNRPVKPGMFLTVEIPARPPVMRKPILVRVTHVRGQVGGRWWVLGGQFVRKLTREDLDTVTVRQPLIRPPVERRTAVRLKTRINTVCPVVRATEEGPWWASVRNASIQSVSLILNRPLRPGCCVAIELPTKSATLGKARLLCIKQACPQPGNKWWVVDGQFLTKLTRTELLQMI